MHQQPPYCFVVFGAERDQRKDKGDSSIDLLPVREVKTAPLAVCIYKQRGGAPDLYSMRARKVKVTLTLQI